MKLERAWLSGLIRRRRSRLLGMAMGVAMAVGFTASLGAFFATANAHMSQQALAGSSVDWQVQLSPGLSTDTALKAVLSEPGVTASQTVSYGTLSDLRCFCAGSIQDAGAGRILGISSTYSSTFPHEIRYLIGAHHGVLIAQQATSNLSATVGSVIQMSLPGGRLVKLRIDGIIDLPFANSMFQVVGAPPGYAPNAPPDNVVFVPLNLWQSIITGSAATLQSFTQLHVKISSNLPANPSSSYSLVVAQAHHLEAKLAGGVQVGNNVAVLLDSARKDALYAELLFLFLGVPGAIVAIILASVLGVSGATRRRKEQAILRLRGATPRRVIRLAVDEGLLVGVLGVSVGLLLAQLASRVSFQATHLSSVGSSVWQWSIAAGVGGLFVAVAVVVIPAWRDLRTLSVTGARANVATASRPLWSLFYVDLIALGLAALIYWRTAGNNFQLVVAPEGISTTSVDYTVFFAPLLFWIGAALLTWRLATMFLQRSGSLMTRLIRPFAGPLANVVTASMRRQRSLLTRGLVIVTLTGSFAVSTAVFNETFSKQTVADARLTLGADVAITTAGSSSLPSALASQIKALPNVSAVTSMLHRFAYVGTDLQDLFGVRADQIANVATVADAFFVGVSAHDALHALTTRPDAILVSEETAVAYLLKPGSLVQLRLQFASDHSYHTVNFHFVGVAREFPTAPHDSFFITNQSYVAAMTGNIGVQTILVRTLGHSTSLATQIRALLPPGSGAVVRDINAQLAQTSSGLTTVDLTGLTRLELTLALLLATAASGLVLALGLGERRRMFAIATAIGARSKHLAAFVWSEVIFVLAGGILAGTVIGFSLAELLVKLLTGVFDPPPTSLSAPVLYLSVLFAVTVGSGVVAAYSAIRVTRNPAIEIVRDL